MSNAESLSRSQEIDNVKRYIYRNQLMRVAGYSDYFVHLNRTMRNEVIRRSEFRSL